ncbi:hypothetical protein NKH77_46730 [Streptomyces sp. M19]
MLCALGLAVAVPATARADSSGGGDLQVAQTLGDRDLTLMLRRVTGLPGPCTWTCSPTRAPRRGPCA